MRLGARGLNAALQMISSVGPMRQKHVRAALAIPWRTSCLPFLHPFRMLGGQVQPPALAMQHFRPLHS